MKECLKVYHVELRTIGPLFIGDGQSLQKKEYVKKGNMLYIPDLQKMYQGLEKMRLLSEYEDFMLNQDRFLGDWFCRKKISPETYMGWMNYTLDCGDVSLERKTQLEIKTFVKDPYGCPYVPGSSLKGMLRTILAAGELRRCSEQYNAEKQELLTQARNSGDKKYYLKRQADNLEVKIYHRRKRLDKRPADVRNAVNDFMSCLHISDSKPLSVKDLTVCQKQDMSLNGNLHSLNLARECIKPGTVIEFDMTIEDGFPYTVEEILEDVKLFAQTYHNSYYKFFQKMNRDLIVPRVSYVWLGGGAGYVSKTLVYPLLGREQGLKAVASIMMKTVNDRRHRHQDDMRKGVSPHVLKCTKYKGKVYEFGQCSIRIR